MFLQLLQIAGALLILTAYASAQLNYMEPSSRVYLWLNLVGSVILAVLAWIGSQWGFLLLEGAWALISVRGLLQRRAPAAEA
jgi:hypothetical protein